MALHWETHCSQARFAILIIVDKKKGNKKSQGEKLDSTKKAKDGNPMIIDNNKCYCLYIITNSNTYQDIPYGGCL